MGKTTILFFTAETLPLIGSYNYDVGDSDVVIRMETRSNDDSSNVFVEINSTRDGNKIGITEIGKL